MSTPAMPPPPISWWGHAWRLGVASLVSLMVFVVSVVERLQIQDDGTALNETSATGWLLLSPTCSQAWRASPSSCSGGGGR
jgi:hypothetical protein